MKLNITTIFLCSVLLGSAMPAAAFTGGAAETRVLSQMLVNMREQLKEMRNQLSELKATSDAVAQTKDFLDDVHAEYQFLSNFDPEQEWRLMVGVVDDFRRRGERIRNADDLMQRWRVLSGELEQRLRRESNAPEAITEARIQHAKAAALDIFTTEYLADSYRDAALNPERGQTTKDLHRQTASSTALTASLLLEEKQARMEREIAVKERALSAMEWDSQFMDWLGDRGRK